MHKLNTTEAIEKTTLPLQRLLMEDIKRYKELLRSCGRPRKNWRFTLNEKEKPLEILADALHIKRDALKSVQKEDLMQEKSEFIKNSSRNILEDEVRFYKDSSGENYWHNEQGEAPDNKKVKCYLVVTNGYHSFKKMNPLFYWKDEMIEFIKTRDESKLHHKFSYFRIGNEFFSKKDYFLFEGKPYSNKEYVVIDGKPASLSDVLKIEASSKYIYRFRNQTPNWSKNYYLEAENDEKFVDVGSNMPEDSFLRISHYHSDMTNGLLGSQFLNTMFISNKQRFYNGHNSHINLTKEQCLTLDVEPSSKHKELYATIEKDFEEVYNKYSSGGRLTVPNFRENIMSGIGFYVELLNKKTNGIMAQILKEIFPNGRVFMPVPELKKRLAIMRELLEKEKEYAKQ